MCRYEGKHWNHPPWPGTAVTICMSYFMTRGPDKEYGTNKPPSTGRIWGQVKRRHQSIMSYKPPRILLAGIHLGWVMHVPPGRTLNQSDWDLSVSVSNNRETSPIIIKPKTASHVVEQSSWVPLLCCSLPRHPFPIKSLVLSARVSPWTIHFWVLGKKPLLGPGRGPPFWNNMKKPFLSFA